MTTEQNQPQPQPNQAAPAAGQTQGQGQHRRRRRRRKGFANGSNKAQTNGHANVNGQAADVAQPSAKQPGKSKSNQHRFSAKNSNGRNGGNGNGGAQGGRRKNKPRRQQTFVGPMDHSYRAANGNMADVSPSTIEFRGNSQNGFYVEAPPPEPAVAPIRENAPTRIFCFIEDLFFLAKIQETARKVGVKVGFVKADKDIVSRLADVPEGERPSLIVFDLNNVAAKPLTLIPRIKSKLKRGTSVIGFLSHLQGDLKAKAIEAGCDMVMPRSAFSQNLPNLLRRHGLEEELEIAEA
jgi:hypothetical protein